jgi:hypothetical protein
MAPSAQEKDQRCRPKLSSTAASSLAATAAASTGSAHSGALPQPA